ncbi:hypothetical protein LEP1GSC132_2653 [Leptospira kirschneri str. 200803703]|nr:hypothetical protein LEP1GSC064_2410 [Leptospira kirschneri serovar Grippotyphosa str. Moskva]EMO68259.1 hypothetical protein LEP1GSC132_2653 [Leptospira kirschneri str. 200803703]EMO74462.1 hypothetical protein LEP1GSC127_2380 [Leptospira kirschneri str. 200801925]
MFYNQFESRNAQIFFRIRNYLNRFCKTVPIYILSSFFKTVPE